MKIIPWGMWPQKPSKTVVAATEELWAREARWALENLKTVIRRAPPGVKVELKDNGNYISDYFSHDQLKSATLTISVSTYKVL